MTRKTAPKADGWKRIMRIAFGCSFALGAFYIDFSPGYKAERSLFQMVLWTVVLFGYSIVELQVSLKRKAQKYIAVGLVLLHFAFLYLIRGVFPLQTSILILAGLLPEGLLLVFLYARIGQSVDPAGPFGLTAAEKRERALARPWR